MLLNIFWLILGLFLILIGADALTDGASSIARKFGVSDFVIGLTIVAMGTSAPELVVSVTAAIEGSAPLAIGNVVGSNIFNILVILGITALVRPIAVNKAVLHTEIPIVLLSSLALLVMGNSVFLDGSQQDVITRVLGIFLLFAFILYMRHTLKAGDDSKPSETTPSSSSDEERMPMLKACIWVIAGLAALVFGGAKFVDGASALAAALGISDAIIGLTIVAAGTSLPELATSIVAATKGNQGLAVGNVIGSCIFNVFFVLGVSAVVRPLPFGDITNIDLLTLVGASLLFWITGRWIGKCIITRVEGAFMAIIYAAYIAVKIILLP